MFLKYYFVFYLLKTDLFISEFVLSNDFIVYTIYNPLPFLYC